MFELILKFETRLKFFKFGNWFYVLNQIKLFISYTQLRLANQRGIEKF